MIENARGMIRLKEIVESGKGYIDGLLVSHRIGSGGVGVEIGVDVDDVAGIVCSRRL